jgi:hypothetical protein
VVDILLTKAATGFYKVRAQLAHPKIQFLEVGGATDPFEKCLLPCHEKKKNEKPYLIDSKSCFV